MAGAVMTATLDSLSVLLLGWECPKVDSTEPAVRGTSITTMGHCFCSSTLTFESWILAPAGRGGCQVSTNQGLSTTISMTLAHHICVIR